MDTPQVSHSAIQNSLLTVGWSGTNGF
ncbi:uncharacterized protein METZ01_LOCUS308763 [marine metagenome]|uniref:Uncharacterized protein n=1 Tax=marine metagenome TaxID=408172 RepID=A0A382N408_9ZZZZ